MAARNQSSSYKLWKSMVMFYRNKIQLMSTSNDICSPLLTPLAPGIYGTHNAGLRSLGFSTGPASQNVNELNKRINKEGGSTQNVPHFVPPATSRFNIFNWVKCFIGSVLSILIPFWKLKWDNLQKLEGKVEMAVEEVEEVVEAVEKVAMMTEKASAVVAELVPQNCGLKQTALAVEHVCEVVVEDAEQTKRFINKVNDLKQDLECLEKIVEPVIDKIVEMEHNKK